MAKVVKNQEFAAVSALPGPDRYTHFIGQVVDWGDVWGLCGPGRVGARRRRQWPTTHAGLAARAVRRGMRNRGVGGGSVPEAIPLDRWLEGWLPGIARDGRAVAVFPVPNGVGVTVEAEWLACDLSEALEEQDG